MWCRCDFAWGQSYWSPPFSLHASPVTAANCILTDYQRGAVNHQPRELQGKRVRGCFQQTEMEKMMKSKSRQRGGGGGGMKMRKRKKEHGFSQAY